ncbi:MAG: MmcQ/YjbR family DNA-binding protein [Terracoccus sp.]
MAHPIMFDVDDPYLARLRAICLALPEADEKVAHGRPTFFTKKVFAYYGGTIKGDHDPEPYGQSLLFDPDPDDRPALLADRRFFEPAYLGPYGWLGLNFRPAGGVAKIDWTEVAELVDASYRRTAPARLVKALDG